MWAGQDTGYASNRAMMFQQLPTAGLPWPLDDWSQYEGYLDDMVRTGVMDDATEVRWDIRPAPRWGTIEVRACDGMSTLPELAAVDVPENVLLTPLDVARHTALAYRRGAARDPLIGAARTALRSRSMIFAWARVERPR